MLAVFEYIGSAIIKCLEFFGSLFILLGQCLKWIGIGAVRIKLTIQQMAHLGVDSLLIVVLTTTSAGMVISLQLASLAVQYGITNMVGGGVALAMARELAPMLTAVVVAGRAGSAIAAELGTMKVTEQISALTCMAVSPVRYLVVPRFLALTLMLPLLTLFSLMAGTAGGAIVAFSSAGIPYEVFNDSIVRFLQMRDIYCMGLKALVFGAEVSLISCWQGINTGRGAAGVGTATTTSVVYATIIIFVTNYLMSMWLWPVS